MNLASLKQAITGRLWEVVDAQPGILSATLTGSFLDAETLEAVSDIDLVVVVEQLNRPIYEQLLAAFDGALRGELAGRGLSLRINATLGPLKFNDANTAVLHLMLYSAEAHEQHAIHSPFTCLDWQRSPVVRKRSLAEMFPVVALQPQHFLSSRRSPQSYLQDLQTGVVSYRELVCTDDGYCEARREKPMTVRDRYEFAFHVMRFLMQNLLKLVRRTNQRPADDRLAAEYCAVFPTHAAEVQALFQNLRARKQTKDFAASPNTLERELATFLESFEAQFRHIFLDEPTRHVAFRHGPTALNRAARAERIFLGRSDPPLAADTPEAWRDLAAQVKLVAPVAVYSSPLGRCRQSLAALNEQIDLPTVKVDDRLSEIDYGALEGMTVESSRAMHSELFAAWGRQEDPRFPGGESTQDVHQRISQFVAERWQLADGNSLTCTHNVVLRCLVGHTLGLAPHQWHRLEIPHRAPLTFVQTRQHGLFVDIPDDVARGMFRDLAVEPREPGRCRS